MTTPIPADVKYVARHKYAWPGGYPMYVVTDDGGVLCADCTKSEWRQIAHDTVKDWKGSGWVAVGADINYEDPDLYCSHCNERVEAAYEGE